MLTVQLVVAADGIFADALDDDDDGGAGACSEETAKTNASVAVDESSSHAVMDGLLPAMAPPPLPARRRRPGAALGAPLLLYAYRRNALTKRFYPEPLEVLIAMMIFH